MITKKVTKNTSLQFIGIEAVLLVAIFANIFFPQNIAHAATSSQSQAVDEIVYEQLSKNSSQFLNLKKNNQAILLTSPKSNIDTANHISVIRSTIVVATGYSSTPDQTDASPFITANGMYVYDGLIAANFLTLGTKVRIPDHFGDKIFTVNDRMNSRYQQGRIDIWFKTRQEAKIWGARTIKIEIIK